MKIIRRGAPWTFQIECVKCQSLLLVEESDITLEPSRMAHKHDLGEANWQCLVCKNRTVVTVPDHVLEMARNKATWNVGQ